MYDIIKLLDVYYNDRNLPGFFNHREKEDCIVTKQDNVLKLQSYEYKTNSCIITHYDSSLIDYLLSLLSVKKKYCLCVNLNHLEYHHAVFDIDFKLKKDISLEFVQDFIKDFIQAVKIITQKKLLILVMFVKCKSRTELSEQDVLQSAMKGVHFEIPECVLYRGDNIWFIEIMKKILTPKYDKDVNLIDSPVNWCFPYSKKKTGEMYLPVREYYLNTEGFEVNICVKDEIQICNRFSIVNNNKEVSYEFALRSDSVGYQFGFCNNEKIFKDRVLSELNSNSQISGYILVDVNLMPHINYAITRFNKDNCCSYVIGETPTSKSLHPFTLNYLREELLFHFDALSRGDSKAKSIFNLYVFLIELNDKFFESNITFKDEVLTEINHNQLKSHYEKISETIRPLINETNIQVKESDNPIRKINPILFIKCLFTQSYLESNKIELVFDDTTNDSVFIPNKIFQLIDNESLTILDIIKFMYPIYASSKDPTVYYYEQNCWTCSSNKFEHLFIPNKILQKFNIRSLDAFPEEEGGSTAKKRKTNNNTNKLFHYLITFWGRIKLLNFPSNVMSFEDGFVQITTDYIIFHHTPLFRGMPSKLGWLNLSNKINHVIQESCCYPEVINRLIPSTVNGQRDDVIEYFKFNYTKEIGPIFECNSLKRCNSQTDCPVFNSLNYLLSLFSEDLELTFFMIWTLRYCILGMSIKKALIYFGHGANGKTTFSNILRILFGNSLQFLSTESIQGKINLLMPDLYAAKNAKMVYVDDLHKINTATLKQIVSGAFMYVRTLYQTGCNIQMKFLFTGSCNNLKLDVDFATLKRILIVPFVKYFQDNNKYYCNQNTFKRIAEDLFATIIWVDRFSEVTNIFYDNQTNIVMPPKSIQWYSHELIWKDDITTKFIKAFDIMEGPSYFITPEDLIGELNRLRAINKYPKHLRGVFDDIDALVNLLKHRYSVGSVLNRGKNKYESVIVGITMKEHLGKYNNSYELI